MLISEFLDGPSLRAAMPPAVSALTFDQAASTVLKVLSALVAIHPDMPRIVELAEKADRSDDEERELERLRGKGITHRDAKPENIIGERRTTGARRLRAGSGRSSGRFGRHAEDRPAGAAFDHADPDLDLFAVGVVLHELLTGETPYTDRDPVGGVLTVDPGLPAGVRELLARACSPRFEDRFRSAQDFVQALVVLGVDEVPMPWPPLNVTERMRGIQNAIAERRWEDALYLCPAEWLQIRGTVPFPSGTRPGCGRAGTALGDRWVLAVLRGGTSVQERVLAEHFRSRSRPRGCPGVSGARACRRDVGDHRPHC